MKTTSSRISFVAAIAALLFVGSAYADGEIGTTSTDSTTLSVETTSMIQIINMAAALVDESPYDPTGAPGVNEVDDVCIYTNQENGAYRVTAEGSGDDDAFILEAAGDDTIPYTVTWYNQAAGGGSSTALVPGEATGNITGASSTHPCPADNASYRVQMTHANIMSVAPGTYTGTLTIIVAPAPL